MNLIQPHEVSIVILVIFMVFFILIRNYISKDPLDLWSPITIIALIFLYYVVIGPYLALVNEKYFYRLINHRDYFYNAWKLSLISLVFILIGFNIKVNAVVHAYKEVPSTNTLIKSSGIRLYLMAVVALIILNGITGFTRQINFMDPTEASGNTGTGTFANYFYTAINFLTPAACFMLVATMKKQLNIKFFIFFLAIVLAIYTTEAFRWRHVVLILSLGIIYFSIKKQRPSPVWILGVSFVAITAMGIIGTTRQYGRGLALDKLQGKETESMFMEGFSEATVFLTTGLLVEAVPEHFEYIGFDPIIQSIAMPVPRQLWPNKPSGKYIRILERLYGEGSLGKGVAVLNFGEYYLAFGWIGAMIGAFLIGYIYKRLWVWFKANRDDPFVVVFYALAASYLYVIISRGYLPQVTMIFFFTVFPAYVVYRIHNKIALREHWKNVMKQKLEERSSENLLVK